MSQVHSSFFRGNQNEEKDDDDDDDDDEDEDEEEPMEDFDEFDDVESITDGYASPENIKLFLYKAQYDDDEAEQFHFLLERGLDLDQTADMIFQRRLNKMDETGIKVRFTS